MKALFCFAVLLLLFPFHGQGQEGQLYKLELRKEVNQMPWRDSLVHYLIDKDARPYPASKDVVIRSFYPHRSKIEDYVKRHDLDFKNESDLRALLSFCYQLSAKK